MGQSVQRDLSSRERVAEEASQQFTSGLASAAATSALRAGETFDGRAMGWSYESSGSQTDRALLQEAESLTHRCAESGLSSQQFAAALSAGIGASNKSDRAAATEAIKGVLKGGGTLTGTYATNEQLQDQIASDKVGGFLTKFSQSGALAREGLSGIVDEYGQMLRETGEHIAELLTQSAISEDDTYLRTIGAYSRANTGGTRFPPL